jgi:hypothetical protein
MEISNTPPSRLDSIRCQTLMCDLRVCSAIFGGPLNSELRKSGRENAETHSGFGIYPGFRKSFWRGARNSATSPSLAEETLKEGMSDRHQMQPCFMRHQARTLG